MFGFCEPFDKVTVLMSGRKIIQLPSKFIPAFLIKRRGLEAVTANQYQFAIAFAGFVFGGFQQGTPIAMSAP